MRYNSKKGGIFLKGEDGCIFCKIVEGKLPSAKIWEDDEFLAILDIYPNTEGMTLVITKKHYGSDVFSLPTPVYNRFLDAVREVSSMLKKGLGVERVAMVAEGMGINHAHIKLYPLWGLKREFEPYWAEERVFFEKYEGYISTLLGPKKDIEELKRLAERIVKNARE